MNRRWALPALLSSIFLVADIDTQQRPELRVADQRLTAELFAEHPP